MRLVSGSVVYGVRQCALPCPSSVPVCIFFCTGGFFIFKQKTAYEMRISDWSSDVCSSDLGQGASSNMGAISQLNLRGLGPNRTLVLLNGHRLTPANTG